MKLKELRTHYKKTQLEVAKDLGISQQNLCRYENGQTKLPMDFAIICADYFNVSLDYLCGRQYNNQIGYIPDEKKEIVKKLLELEDINLIKADSYITALLDSEKK